MKLTKPNKALFWSLAGLVLLAANPAQAVLDRASITSYKITAYGMYTTADATCTTGFTATIPTTTTATQIDIATAQKIGKGKIATDVKCIVFILKNTMSTTWATGTYSSTTSGNPDSVCNTTGTYSGAICTSQTPDWPTELATLVDATGLTRTTSCTASPTGSEVIPVYFSTYSLCNGNQYNDTAGTTALCYSGGNYPIGFNKPTAANSITKGMKLTVPTSGKSKYKFIIDPDKTVGNESSICRSVSPPAMSFVEKTD